MDNFAFVWITENSIQWQREIFYPILRIDNILDQLGTAKFSTTDLASRYCLLYYFASCDILEVESGKEGKNDVSTLIITLFLVFFVVCLWCSIFLIFFQRFCREKMISHSKKWEMDDEANMEMESNSKVSIAEGSKLRDLFVQYKRGFHKHAKSDIDWGSYVRYSNNHLFFLTFSLRWLEICLWWRRWTNNEIYWTKWSFRQ